MLWSILTSVALDEQHLPALVYLCGEVAAVLTLDGDMLIALEQAREHVSPAREDECHFVILIYYVFVQSVLDGGSGSNLEIAIALRESDAGRASSSPQPQPRKSVTHS